MASFREWKRLRVDEPFHIVSTPSQKQSAHWAAVDITAQVVPCWLGSWLKCNFWPVLRQPPWVYFPFTRLDATWVSSIKTVNSGDVLSCVWEITWVSSVWTPESSLNLIRPLYWISTERWLRWWNSSGVSYFLWECLPERPSNTQSLGQMSWSYIELWEQSLNFLAMGQSPAFLGFPYRW